MSYSPLAIKRKHVLGDLYDQCESIESIPVYLNDESGELLGYVDESMGRYADAFVFHLSEPICKSLSTGHYTYVFDFDFLVDIDKAKNVKKRRIKLNHIRLVPRKSPA
jgi:hypothetical protein